MLPCHAFMARFADVAEPCRFLGRGAYGEVSLVPLKAEVLEDPGAVSYLALMPSCTRLASA